MNWQMLLYFLRKVVPAGEWETEELMKLYAEAQKQIQRELAA
jgi:hypothetical protein